MNIDTECISLQPQELGWSAYPDWIHPVSIEDISQGTSLEEDLSEGSVWLNDGDAAAQLSVNTGAVIIVRAMKKHGEIVIGTTFATSRGVDRDFVKQCASKYNSERIFDVVVFGGARTRSGNSMRQTVEQAFGEFDIFPQPAYRTTPDDTHMNIGIARVGDEIEVAIEIQRE